MASDVVIDDAARTVTKTTTGDVEMWQTTHKPGSPGANRQAIEDQLDQAIGYFSGNVRSWAGLTAAQKDAAARNAQRALANLCRLVRGQLDTAD